MTRSLVAGIVLLTLVLHVGVVFKKALFQSLSNVQSIVGTKLVAYALWLYKAEVILMLKDIPPKQVGMLV